MRVAMLQTEQNVGKLKSTPTVAKVGVPKTTNRLSVHDRNTNQCFLVDTGADISVLAATTKNKYKEEGPYTLYAANNTKIKTYGEKTITLNLGLRRSFTWTFIIAEVKTSILGADFLRHYQLLVDLHKNKLVDSITELSVKAIQIASPVDVDGIRLLKSEQAYHDILKQYPDILHPFSRKKPVKHDVVHHIETSGQPLFARPRPLPPDKYKAAKEEFKRMMEMGICKPSNSPWANPMHIVKKKDGGLRVCGDYRRLNTVTKPDRYPIPRIQDFTYSLHNKKIYTKLDLKMAYYCIPMASSEDAQKTAIITPFGLYEFTSMPFGLRNASQTFQRFMHEVLRNIEDCFCFVDDILLYSENEEQHKKLLHEVLRRLNDYGVTLNIEKCQFGVNKLDFLGYEVSEAGIKPTEERTSAISCYPKPKTVIELRRFLGMINYYRNCLPQQANLHHELNKYLHNGKKNDKTVIDWTPAAEESFEKCRQSILQATTLSHPVPNSPLAIMTDASDHSIGAVLQQRTDNVWRPLAYFSKAMSATQQRYSVYDRELLAIYTAVRHFRRLIEGCEVTVYTDHKPLTYALTKSASSSDTPRRERQTHFISQFCSAIKYIQGEDNTVADALSRIEEIICPTTIDFNQLSIDQSSDKQLQNLRSQQNLKFREISLPGLERQITCELSTSTPRPYLPQVYRYAVFKSQHDLSHPGVRATRRLIQSKYFWPSMNKDVTEWARTCISCQRAKVQRHVITPLQSFPQSQRFEHVHIDIVGPLRLSRDYRYCVTMTDRCTKWLEAIPVQEITAEVVARAFYDNWIARFGVPLRITTDQGRQFESSLFRTLLQKFGITRIRTTAFHPQSNGQIERWHRTMKTALVARGASTQWTDELPTVLLGLRTALREDTQVSPALMTYGATLRVPSDFFVPSASKIEDAEFVQKLTETMAMLKPQQRSCEKRSTFIHKDLQTCSHVFVRNDTVRPPLTPPYDGPYEVLQRHDKYFKIKLPLRTTVVSLDRLKPAYLLNQEAYEAEHTSSTSSSSPQLQSQVRVTRSGRVSKPVVRFA